MLFQKSDTEEKRKKIDIDESLFIDIANGNKEAFTRLYQLTDKVIYAYILSILKNTEDTKDVMQETYLKVLSAAHLYQPQGKPLAWMFTIARNLSLMHIRKNAKHDKVEPAELENRQDLSYIEHTDDRLVLEAALNILNEREHQMILLHVMAGWKHREIATYMDLSLANTIKTYNRNVVETSITIDVNPSFEIQLNKNEEVKKVIGVNEDGKEIIEQADFKDKNLEHTVEELIRVLDNNGYFKKKSAVLVSVQNKKEETAQSMEKKLKKQIKKICENSEKKPKVYAQEVGQDKEIEEIAKNYHISKGRATFICNMVKKDSEWKIEDLVSMSIEELVSSAKEKGVKVSEILEKTKKKEDTKQTETKKTSESIVTVTPNKNETEKSVTKEKTKNQKSKTTIKDTEQKNDATKETSKDKEDKNKKTEESTQQSDSGSTEEESSGKQKDKKNGKGKGKDKDQEETPQPTPTEQPATEEPVATEDPDPHGKHGGGKPGKGGRAA